LTASQPETAEDADVTGTPPRAPPNVRAALPCEVATEARVRHDIRTLRLTQILDARGDRRTCLLPHEAVPRLDHKGVAARRGVKPRGAQGVVPPAPEPVADRPIRRQEELGIVLADLAVGARGQRTLLARQAAQLLGLAQRLHPAGDLALPRTAARLRDGDVGDEALGELDQIAFLEHFDALPHDARRGVREELAVGRAPDQGAVRSLNLARLVRDAEALLPRIALSCVVVHLSSFARATTQRVAS